MLELVKRRIVTATQPDLFGDIQIDPTGDMDESENGDETEFID
jgi:chromatin segregation and condensation protein Rec8/ScpA/Scc1 (kleisin family)